MNKRLFQLYEKYWDKMISALKEKELGNPLLLYLNDEQKYKEADIKIMFFGQETNEWEGEIGGKNINELLETYSKFIASKYGGQFWNAVRDYVNTIKQMNPSKSVEYVWNNVIKIGKATGKGAPDKYLVEMQKEVFPVIKEEVEILKPDIFIFFTGPYYDDYIEREWNGILMDEDNHFNVRQLALLKHKLLPINTFRTYHPNYLYRNGKQYYLNIKNTIIASNT